ncbi:unannotated protein [freshwater metagenome]|uniref:Unannotated protein n=1 Tax=freshwater metagenome TaxID=449393 RepID=A0A6J6QA27_9ZZZZ
METPVAIPGATSAAVGLPEPQAPSRRPVTKSPIANSPLGSALLGLAIFGFISGPSDEVIADTTYAAECWFRQAKAAK